MITETKNSSNKHCYIGSSTTTCLTPNDEFITWEDGLIMRAGGSYKETCSMRSLLVSPIFLKKPAHFLPWGQGIKSSNNVIIIMFNISIAQISIHMIMIKCALQYHQEIKSTQMLVLEERGKPEYQEKNLSGQSREPTNSAHL